MLCKRDQWQCQIGLIKKCGQAMIKTENMPLLAALDPWDVLVQAESWKHSTEHTAEVAQKMKMHNFISDHDTHLVHYY